MTQPSGKQGNGVGFMEACRHDIPDLAALVRARLPEMTLIQDEKGWYERARFGPGRHPRDKLTMVARADGGHGPLLGFFWVDDAMASDFGVADPWWCINAIAVSEHVAGRGLGKAFVNALTRQAADVGVTNLYGLCYPSSAGFWAACAGYSVGEVNQDLESNGPVQLLDGSTRPGVNLACEPGHHFFICHLGDPLDGRTRLVFA